MAAMVPTIVETETRRTRAWPRNKLAAASAMPIIAPSSAVRVCVPMRAIAATPTPTSAWRPLMTRHIHRMAEVPNSTAA